MIYTLKLTEQQLGLIDQAIGEMPYRVAAGLIAAIGSQVQAQAAEAATEKPEAAKPKRQTRP